MSPRISVTLLSLVLLSLSGCGPGKPEAWLRPESHNCRSIALPADWRLPNDPAHAPGYFADDPAARLVYRLDPSSGDILVGLALPAANDLPAEVCPRHFALSLATRKVVEVTAGQWDRGRPFVAPFGIGLVNPNNYSGLEPLILRLTNTVKTQNPFASESDLTNDRQLSPDRRFLALSTISGPAVAKGFGYEGYSDILVDIDDVASGKRVASLRGRFQRTDPTPLLNGGAWISDRHLILPALADHSELILCDLNAESPAADPVMPVADHPMLFAIDTGSDESWTHAGESFPFITALALVPAAEWWNFQWRATNPAGKSAVVLTEGARPGGFLWFPSPIPGNDLRDGPYQIDAFAFLERQSNRRIAATATAFTTPPYQYPRPDYAAMQASSQHPERREERRPSRIPSQNARMWGELDAAAPVKEGAAAVFTVDCLTKEVPPPVMGFAMNWELHGAKVVIKPDVGPCIKGATKVSVTPPPNTPPGEYDIEIFAQAGDKSWGTSLHLVVEGRAAPASKPHEMVPVEPLPMPVTPIPLTVVPYWGHGTKQRFSFVAIKAEPGPEIATIEARFAFTPQAAPQCKAVFDLSGNRVTLKSEPESPFCLVTAPEIHIDGNSVTVSAMVEFKQAFTGPHGVFIQAVDQKGQSTPLTLLGAWEVR